MHNLFKQSLRRWLLSAGLALLLCLSCDRHDSVAGF